MFDVIHISCQYTVFEIAFIKLNNLKYCVTVRLHTTKNTKNTTNTFCGTWYLPHSPVHKSVAELCSSFGDSAITKGQIAYFYCICAKRLYFYYQSKIWRHTRVLRFQFPIIWRNFGDTATSKGKIAYFFVAHARSGHISTSGYKSDVTIVFTTQIP